jgi:hypothetical protein
MRPIDFHEPIYGRQNDALLRSADILRVVGSINIPPLRGCWQIGCWNYSVRVGESARYPAVCERCVEALKEIEEGS